MRRTYIRKNQVSQPLRHPKARGVGGDAVREKLLWILLVGQFGRSTCVSLVRIRLYDGSSRRALARFFESSGSSCRRHKRRPMSYHTVLELNLDRHFSAARVWCQSLKQTVLFEAMRFSGGVSSREASFQVSLFGVCLSCFGAPQIIPCLFEDITQQQE